MFLFLAFASIFIFFRPFIRKEMQLHLSNHSWMETIGWSPIQEFNKNQGKLSMKINLGVLGIYSGVLYILLVVKNYVSILYMCKIYSKYMYIYILIPFVLGNWLLNTYHTPLYWRNHGQSWGLAKGKLSWRHIYFGLVE